MQALPFHLGFIALLGLAMLACSSSQQAPAPAPTPPPPQFTDPAHGWQRGDLHVHSNRSPDAHNGDDPAVVVSLAEAWGDTSRAGSLDNGLNSLDFLALTDHRRLSRVGEDGYVSGRLALLPGMEAGRDGHFGILGADHLRELPGGAPRDVAQLQAALQALTARGAVVSLHHPTLPGDPFVWPAEGFSLVEAWNGPWSIRSQPLSEARLDRYTRRLGLENPYIRRAARATGGGRAGQGLAFLEALLTAGQAVGVTGGSDRHFGWLPGYPTTYVQANTRDLADILAGLRARHTFVSRSPAGPQLILQASGAHGAALMGDVFLRPEALTLQVQVARAPGGRLWLLSGSVQPGASRDWLLARSRLGQIILDVPIRSSLETFELPWHPVQGGWVLALVLEPIDLSAVRPFAQWTLLSHLKDHAKPGGRPPRLVRTLSSLTPVGSLLLPSMCAWNPPEPGMAACVPGDQDAPGTLYFSETLSRVLNRFYQDGEGTDWAMGALSSPILVLPGELQGVKKAPAAAPDKEVSQPPHR